VNAAVASGIVLGDPEQQVDDVVTCTLLRKLARVVPPLVPIAAAAFYHSRRISQRLSCVDIGILIAGDL
jgi:hypothetical protein